LLGQDLWDIVGGSNITAPRDDDEHRRWKIKTGKALYALAVTIKDNLLPHIRSAQTPREAWDNLVALFARSNDAKLQRVENELLSMSQQNMTVS